MSHTLWTEVDNYICGKLLPSDKVLEESLNANIAGGLPSYDVSPAQGKLLNILVRMHGAKRVLEVGTLGGYSAIWMAQALPADGKLVSLEYVSRHAEVARENIERAGLSDKVEIRVGEAAKTLADLQREGQAPFDFIFIDADKSNNAIYLDWALRLARKGTVIVCDNVIRDGDIVDTTHTDPGVEGTRAAFDFIAANPGLDATAIQTVGTKGYDGFIIATVTQDA